MWEFSIKMENHYLVCIFPETVSPVKMHAYLGCDDPVWILGPYYAGKYHKPLLRKYNNYAQSWLPLYGIGNLECFMGAIKELPR